MFCGSLILAGCPQAWRRLGPVSLDPATVPSTSATSWTWAPPAKPWMRSAMNAHRRMASRTERSLSHVSALQCGPYHSEGRYPARAGLVLDSRRRAWLLQSINIEPAMRQSVKVVRERPMVMKCLSPEVQLLGPWSQIARDHLVRPLALLIRDPVVTEEAGVSDRKHQYTAARKNARKLCYSDINSGYVHQHHVRQHDIKMTISKREALGQIGNPVENAPSASNTRRRPGSSTEEGLGLFPCIAYGWSPRLLTPPTVGTSTSCRTVGDP
jgi:hypothetical protein